MSRDTSNIMLKCICVLRVNENEIQLVCIQLLRTKNSIETMNRVYPNPFIVGGLEVLYILIQTNLHVYEYNISRKKFLPNFLDSLPRCQSLLCAAADQTFDQAIE